MLLSPVGCHAPHFTEGANHLFSLKPEGPSWSHCHLSHEQPFLVCTRLVLSLLTSLL